MEEVILDNLNDNLNDLMLDMGEDYFVTSNIERYERVLKSVPNLKDMTEDEFNELILQRISVLDENEQKEFLEIINDDKNCWCPEGETNLSVREEILIMLHTMISSIK